MDISKLSHGAKLVLGATIVFLIVSIFNWQAVDTVVGSYGVSMWHGWGVLAGLIAIAIIVWEGLRLANMKIEIGLTPAMVTTALSILLLVFTVLKFLVNNEFRTFWAWLGLILAICIVAGAFANMRMAGESIGEMTSSMVAAAGSAAGAARQAASSATEKAGEMKDVAGSGAGTAGSDVAAAGETGAEAASGDEPPSTA